MTTRSIAPTSRHLGLAAALALASAWAAPAGADFLDAEIGARALGLGGAFVAVADDPNAVAWNAAGLAQTRGLWLTGQHNALFGVEGLATDFAAASFRPGNQRWALGAGWTRTGQADLYHEDQIMLAGAVPIVRERFMVGATIKRLSVEAPGYEYYNDPAYKGAVSHWSADVGALLRTRRANFGVSAHNVNRPEFRLLDTTLNPDRVPSLWRFGVAIPIQGSALLSLESDYRPEVPSYYDGHTTFHGGFEVNFYNAFVTRAGVDDGRLGVGLGIKFPHGTVDTALLTHRRLGNIYRVSVDVRP